MSAKHPSPNDQRSVAKNPTSAAYAADVANRTSLGHANAPAESPQPPPQQADKSPKM